MKFAVFTFLVLLAALVFRNASGKPDVNEASETPQTTSTPSESFGGAGSLIEQWKQTIQDVLTCGVCRTALFTLQKFLNTESEIKFFVRTLCRGLQLAKASSCQGYAQLYAPHLSYVLKHTNLTAAQMCGVFLGKKCLSNPPSKYEFWILPLPAKTKQFAPVKNGFFLNKRILHLSDFHFDPFYKPGALTECDESLCCRANSTNGKGAAGYWGHYNNCDAPLQLLENVVEHINKTQANDFDLLIWTGDNNPHDDWQTTRESILYTSATVSDLLKKYLSKGKLVFPTLGNHEGMPSDQYALSHNSKFDTYWLYNKLAEQWSDWLATDAARSTFKRGGYFSRSINESLKIISLNTNLCARMNLWSLYEPIDSAGQLKWLIEELKASEEIGQRVYILGHIAPGRKCTPIWFHNYIRIIERFRDVVVGVFYGHTHRDEIKIYYSDKNTNDPIHVAYVGPSGSVSNVYSYYLNLTEANEAGEGARLKWRKSYVATEAYGLKTLSTAEWNRFYHLMNKNDTLFQLYYKNIIRKADSMPNYCNEKCKQEFAYGPIAQIDSF
ncbi:sphingomyelin phosphodiesterase-like protein [Dinothrombium tinctorium]|uniref:Sphingomyelin phosphodiesterase n=1 Tax=Dinothrombium tinctorium TaxID=1965070 RepID=A0A3S3RVW0_9ACAR|nr:sphingomyelin phosphodiesterase-like protein [Dinothrombium tinctorium]RWS05513.1 sphingomyelin phosphodiesterase-like protein [Dinothrombium tinctorium]RWS05895.1 sphingomyelin phosphodiesterase-like protein [Dinothrombium tinctorium]